MSAATMNEVRNALLKTKSDIPSKVSAHEKVIWNFVTFKIFLLQFFFFLVLVFLMTEGPSKVNFD